MNTEPNAIIKIIVKSSSLSTEKVKGLINQKEQELEYFEDDLVIPVLLAQDMNIKIESSSEYLYTILKHVVEPVRVYIFPFSSSSKDRIKSDLKYVRVSDIVKDSIYGWTIEPDEKYGVIIGIAGIVILMCITQAMEEPNHKERATYTLKENFNLSLQRSDYITETLTETLKEITLEEIIDSAKLMKTFSGTPVINERGVAYIPLDVINDRVLKHLDSYLLAKKPHVGPRFPYLSLSGLKKDPNLEGIKIPHTGVREVRGLEALKGNDKIQYIYAEESDLREFNLPLMGELPNLETIFLQLNHLTKFDFSSLKSCKKIKAIELGMNEISTIDLSPLQYCQNLEYLSLRMNSLSSIDLRPLSKCQQLNELNLEGNDIDSFDLTPLLDCQALEKVILREEGEKRDFPPIVNGPQNLTIEGVLESDILEISERKAEITTKKTPSRSEITRKEEPESNKAELVYLKYNIDPSVKIEETKLEKYRQLGQGKDYDTLQSKFNQNQDEILTYFHKILYENNPYQPEFSLEEPKVAINILGFLGLQYGNIKVLRLLRDIVNNGDEVHPKIWELAQQKMYPYSEDFNFQKYANILSWDSLIGRVKQEKMIEVITHKEWKAEKGGIGRLLANEDAQFRSIVYKVIIRTFPHEKAMFYCAIGLNDLEEEVKETVKRELERRVGSENSDAVELIKGLAEEEGMKNLSKNTTDTQESSEGEVSSKESNDDETTTIISTKREDEKREKIVEDIASLIDRNYQTSIPNEEKKFLLELGQNKYYDSKKEFLPKGSVTIVNSHITELHIKDTPLTTLPDSIGQLSQLTQLEIWGTQLTTLPESIGQLSKLTQLEIWGNQLTTLPESIGQLSKLTNLDLMRNQLTNLPESFGQLTHLTYLRLMHNQFRTLPNSIRELSKLTDLDLTNNQLTILDESIGQLTQLKVLYLAKNQLTTLPRSINQLSQLRYLDLRLNQLTTLPETFGQLSQLSHLELQENQLTTLPESFGQLGQLKHLEIQKNQLTTLPESFGQLFNLSQLKARNNPFKSLPESIRQIPMFWVMDARSRDYYFSLIENDIDKEVCKKTEK